MRDPILPFFTQPSVICSVPSFTSVPTFDAIYPIVCKAIKDARRIPCSNPASWKPAVQNRWDIEMTRLSKLLNDTMLDPTPVNLFNATFNLLTSPGIVLAPNFAELREPDHAYDADDATVADAVRKILKGQERKAMKILSSDGVASINPETINVLKQMHPQREHELKLPTTNLPQVQILPKDIADPLFLDAGDFSISKDVYGWAPWLLFPVRGVKGGFFDSFVNFACVLANKAGCFPQVCSTLLTAGALTPLNKDPEDERLRRQQAGLPPRLRPINSGTLVAKAVLRAVLLTPAAERAAERTAPFQLSLGVSRGIEKLIHTCRAAYESKWLVGRNDFSNGFNSMSRQKMLEAHRDLFPEGTDVFNFFYGSDSPVFMFDGNDVVTLNSSEGPRQGCTAGTHGFCIGLHPLLVKLHSIYPEFSLRVLTDDIIPLVPPPASNTNEDWQLTYARYADFLNDLEHFSFLMLGLKLNVEKAGLLLPVGAPLPSPEVRSKFPSGFDFQCEGFRVAGSPIGTDRFMHEFVDKKVRDAQLRIVAVKKVGLKSPRAAHRLLSCCVARLLSFLSTTVPPHIMFEKLRAFDEMIEQAFFEIICPAQVECSEERMQRARLKIRLQSPIGCRRQIKDRLHGGPLFHAA